jgi:hypothetical protein
MDKEPIATRQFTFQFTKYPYESQLYDKICESKPGALISPEIPEVPAVLDEEGNEVTPAISAVPAVYEETNEFAGGLKI